MSNKNDAQIMLLKEKIARKKEKISQTKKFAAVTNCSLEIDGARYNLHTLSKQQVIEFWVKLELIHDKIKELELTEYYKIGGYSLENWITDLKNRFEFLNTKEEESKLKQMEATLNKLLSEDKKIELELEEISKMFD